MGLGVVIGLLAAAYAGSPDRLFALNGHWCGEDRALTEEERHHRRSALDEVGPYVPAELPKPVPAIPAAPEVRREVHVPLPTGGVTDRTVVSGDRAVLSKEFLDSIPTGRSFVTAVREIGRSMGVVSGPAFWDAYPPCWQTGDTRGRIASITPEKDGWTARTKDRARRWDEVGGVAEAPPSAPQGPIEEVGTTRFVVRADAIEAVAPEGSLRVFPGRSFSISPDGRRIAVSGDGTLRAYDTATLAQTADLDVYGLDDITAMSWSLDGRLLATGHHGGLVWIWAP